MGRRPQTCRGTSTSRRRQDNKSHQTEIKRVSVKDEVEGTNLLCQNDRVDTPIASVQTSTLRSKTENSIDSDDFEIMDHLLQEEVVLNADPKRKKAICSVM